MSFDVIVLNGGSSSGKSSIVRSLQATLTDTWLTFGVDALIAAMPDRLWCDRDGLDVDAEGRITVGPEFRRLEAAWIDAVAAMAMQGIHIIVDEVFLQGASGQENWRVALDGLSVLWVGVRCDAGEAYRRESVRTNRVVGLAADQADRVHEGVIYDLVVDTTHSATEEVASAIAVYV